MTEIKVNIENPNIGHLYYHLMENLEQQNKIINLGKLLVKELGLTNSTDTLSRWMAHYLAEKIIQQDSLPCGEERDEIEKTCFNTILMLWKHRWLLPTGSRPFESFEPILKVLGRINPENGDPFFYRYKDELLSNEESDLNLAEVNQCSEMILHIDKVAKIWINYIIERMVSTAKNEKIEAFIENAIDEIIDDDINIIDSLLNEENTKIDNYRLKTLIKRTEELKKFSLLNEFLLNEYTKEIESIKDKRSE